MKSRRILYLFLLPALALYIMFFVIPTVAALGLSFTDWNGISSNIPFVGLDNYKELLKDNIFHKSVGNNVKFTLVVLTAQTALSLVFAIFLMKNSKLNVVYRTVFFLPMVLASVSIAFIWMFTYDSNIGALNVMLGNLGLAKQSWLGNSKIAIYSLAFAQIWTHIGQVMIIFIAGLQSIPENLYEAARIEGASAWQTFRYVTWPLLIPAATIVVALTTIQSFRAFDLIFVMTDGGPAYATEIISTFLYHNAFINHRFGLASASAVILMLIIAVITYTQSKLLASQNKGM
ncbi:MAG: sugar ABC transporter permease [Desulfitobacterium hafniense]|nr:sugar ABC transporter permease [Desulfitobacterium hafniense]